MCDGSGSGMATSSSASSGPFRFVIWIARIGRDPKPLLRATDAAPPRLAQGWLGHRLRLHAPPPLQRADPQRLAPAERLDQPKRLVVPARIRGRPARRAVGDL